MYINIITHNRGSVKIWGILGEGKIDTIGYWMRKICVATNRLEKIFDEEETTKVNDHNGHRPNLFFSTNR